MSFKENCAVEGKIDGTEAATDLEDGPIGTLMCGIDFGILPLT
jgi:hypothetical protein